MDLSQVYLLALNIVFVVWVVMVGLQRWIISEPMLDAFLIVYGSTVVLASPTWLAKLYIESRWFQRSHPPAPPVVDLSTRSSQDDPTV